MMSFNRFRAAGWYQRRPIGFTVKLSNKSQPHPSFYAKIYLPKKLGCGAKRLSSLIKGSTTRP